MHLRRCRGSGRSTRLVLLFQQLLVLGVPKLGRGVAGLVVEPAIVVLARSSGVAILGNRLNRLATFSFAIGTFTFALALAVALALALALAFALAVPFPLRLVAPATGVFAAVVAAFQPSFATVPTDSNPHQVDLFLPLSIGAACATFELAVSSVVLLICAKLRFQNGLAKLIVGLQPFGTHAVLTHRRYHVTRIIPLACPCTQ